MEIEKEGIRLDKECFIKYHKDHNTPQFSISKGRAYTQYNLYTLYRRFYMPSKRLQLPFSFVRMKRG